MAEIYLVRHGQASFGTDNYDRLSPRGEYQAQCLGNYFKEREISFDYVTGGTMQRHQQTIRAIAKNLAGCNQFQTHSGWNEFDHEALFLAYIQEHPEDPELSGDKISDYFQDRSLFYRILFRALTAWSQGKVSGAPESWAAFCERVSDAMADLAASNCRRALVSASGGSLSIAVMLATKMPVDQAIDLMRQMKNTGISQLFITKGQWHLHSFNSLSHLDTAQDRHLISYG